MNPYTQRAQLLIQQHRHADAERLLGQGLAESPDDAWSHALLGICLAEREAYTEATERTTQAIALAPDSARVRLIAGEVALLRNDLDSAARLATEAIAIDPSDDRPYSLRAGVHAQRKRWDDCLIDCQQALAIDPEDTRALNLQALANRGLGNSSVLAGNLGDALRSNPENPFTHANSGWAYLEQGDVEQAEKHFREAIRLDPTLETARVGILETTKSKFVFYRWFLAGMLRLQHLRAGMQFALLIGLWLGAGLLSGLADQQPWLKWVALPLIFAYLLLCMATWFWRPVSNAALMLHPFARLALTRKEKIEAGVAAAAFLLTTGLLTAALLNEEGIYFFLWQATLGPLLAIVFSFQMTHPKPRRILLIVAGLLSLHLVYLLALIGLGEPFEEAMPGVLTRLAVGPLNQVRRWAPLLVIFGSQWLAAQHWRRD